LVSAGGEAAIATEKGQLVAESHHDVVVIGSGFGATMTALALARELRGAAGRS